MKKWIVSSVLLVGLLAPIPSHSFFGNPADTAALLKILANSVQQLLQLKSILDNARDQLGAIRDINSGLDSILQLTETLFPNEGLSLYQDWIAASDAKRKLELIYGMTPPSSESKAQRHIDQSAIDAIILNNKVNIKSENIDQVAAKIKRQSYGASPKGASRLAAQGIGVGLHVQNQSLRVQSNQLALQAQDLANKNRVEKQATKLFLDSSKNLKKIMKSHNSPYQTPRF